MLKDYFVKQGVKGVQVTEFIKNNFPAGDYSDIELQRTPLGLKIIIYTNKPGRIIGKGGKTINDITEAVKKQFGIENPQIDVKSVENANLDPNIVAKQISSALERGYNLKKICNLSMKRMLDAGAIGAEIIVAGKVTGSKSMTAKFLEGYLKHCGHSAKELVHKGFAEALTRPGKIGVTVKIMREFQTITGERTTEIRKALPVVEEKVIEEMMAKDVELGGKKEKPKKGVVKRKKKDGGEKKAEAVKKEKVADVKEEEHL